MLWEPQKKTLLTSWDTLAQSDQYVVVYRILKLISTVLLMIHPQTTSAFLDGSLPNCLLERLIMPTGAVQIQKSSKQTIPAFSSHSVSVPEEETSPHRPVWLSFPHHESTVMLLCVTVHYWSLRYTDAQGERERDRFEVKL